MENLICRVCHLQNLFHGLQKSFDSLWFQIVAKIAILDKDKLKWMGARSKFPFKAAFAQCHHLSKIMYLQDGKMCEDSPTDHFSYHDLFQILQENVEKKISFIWNKITLSVKFDLVGFRNADCSKKIKVEVPEVKKYKNISAIPSLSLVLKLETKGRWLQSGWGQEINERDYCS